MVNNTKATENKSRRYFMIVSLLPLLAASTIIGCKTKTSNEALLSATPLATPTAPLNSENEKESHKGNVTAQLLLQKDCKNFIQETQKFMQLPYDQLLLHKCNELIVKGRTLMTSITVHIPQLNEKIIVKQKEIVELNNALSIEELPQFKDKITSMIGEFEKLKNILIKQSQGLENDLNTITVQVELLKKHKQLKERLKEMNRDQLLPNNDAE